MAVAAASALVSLLYSMDQIKTHPLLSTCFSNSQFGPFCRKLNFLADFMENRHSDAAVGEKFDFVVDADSTEEEDLLSRIAAVF